MRETRKDFVAAFCRYVLISLRFGLEGAFGRNHDPVERAKIGPRELGIIPRANWVPPTVAIAATKSAPKHLRGFLLGRCSRAPTMRATRLTNHQQQRFFVPRTRNEDVSVWYFDRLLGHILSVCRHKPIHVRLKCGARSGDPDSSAPRDVSYSSDGTFRTIERFF